MKRDSHPAIALGSTKDGDVVSVSSEILELNSDGEAGGVSAGRSVRHVVTVVNNSSIPQRYVLRAHAEGDAIAYVRSGHGTSLWIEDHTVGPLDNVDQRVKEIEHPGSDFHIEGHEVSVAISFAPPDQHAHPTPEPKPNRIACLRG